jgi:hypothetical protein
MQDDKKMTNLPNLTLDHLIAIAVAVEIKKFGIRVSLG